MSYLGAAGSKSSQNAGSRNPDAGATPSSVVHDEEEVQEEEEESAVKLVRKRSRETTAGASVVPKPGGVPFIGKQSNLRSLYRYSPAKKKTPEKKGVVIVDPQEPVLKKTKITIKPFKTAGAEPEKEKQKFGEKPVAKEKELEKEKVAAQEKEMEKKRAADKPLTEPKETEFTAAIEVTTATNPERAQGPEVIHVIRA
ncbi:hypothetical protein Hanom_Chr14g01266631 [Helianthus anomalus]